MLHSEKKKRNLTLKFKLILYIAEPRAVSKQCILAIAKTTAVPGRKKNKKIRKRKDEAIIKLDIKHVHWNAKIK